MLSNPFSKILIALAVLAAALVTLSFVEKPALSKADLSGPAQPVMIPPSNANDLSDYFFRHPSPRSEPASAGIPVAGADELSDFYQRFKARGSVDVPSASNSANTEADTSDYFLRHRE